METYKQMTDALGEQLLFCAKQKKDKPAHLKKAEEILESGADVNYKKSRAIYFAVKNYNFAFIKLLIRYGALESDLSRKYIAAMCEKGGFNDKREDAFFEILDIAAAKTGFDAEYLAPYINMTLVAGRVDKLCRAAEKYSLSLPRAMSLVRLMIIFEAVNLNRHDSLKLIDVYIDWTEGAVDIAAATGQDNVLDYILSHNGKLTPSKESIARAISAGHASILKVLSRYEIDVNDEFFVKTACRAFGRFPEPLKFLTEIGAIKIGYDGKSVFENAQLEGNAELLAHLRTLKVSDFIM